MGNCSLLLLCCLQNAIVYYRKATDILKTIMQLSCSSRCCTLTNVDYYHASPELKKKPLLQSLNSLLLSWQSLSQQGSLRNTKLFKVPKLPAWPKIGPDVNVWGQQRSTIHLNLQQTRQSIVAIQPITHLAQRLWLLSTKPTTIRQLPVLPLTHLCCKIPQNLTGVSAGGASAVTLLFKTHSLLIVCFESHRPFRQQTNPQKINSLALLSVVMRVSSVVEVRSNVALLISATTTPTIEHRGGKTKPK